MTTSFNDQFDQLGTWRREFALRLKLLGEWMKDNELLDAAVEERLKRLGTQVRSDVHALDLTTMTWRKLGDVTARQNPALVAHEGAVVVVGGYATSSMAVQTIEQVVRGNAAAAGDSDLLATAASISASISASLSGCGR